MLMTRTDSCERSNHKATAAQSFTSPPPRTPRWKSYEPMTKISANEARFCQTSTRQPATKLAATNSRTISAGNRLDIGGSEEHTSELQSLSGSSYAVSWLHQQKNSTRPNDSH